MKTRDGSRILHPAKRMKTSISTRTRDPQKITRFYTGFRRFGVLVAFIAMLAATLYSASSAFHSDKRARHMSDSVSNSAAPGKVVTDKKDRGTKIKDVMTEMGHGNKTALSASWIAPPIPAQSPSLDESIAIYAAPDCVTPKTSFVLGETVCIKVTNAPTGSDVQRKISWVGPDGYIRDNLPTHPPLVDVTTDPQNDSFPMPTSPTTVIDDGFSVQTLNNLGTWRVNTIAASDAGLIASAEFTVRDPMNPAVDLSIAVNQVGTSPAPEGGNVSFTLEVDNKGPDAAQNVVVNNSVPANTTFAAIVQNTGPTFNCVAPNVGDTGPIVCSGTTLAPDERATFTAIYQVAPGTPDDTPISSSASVANSVPDLHPSDGTGTGAAIVGPATCTLACPASITQDNDPGQFGAVVTFNAPAPTGVCGTVTSMPASGEFFPVGTTTVTSSGDSGNSCTFTVTVNDRQAPTIACPSDISVNETSPGSAIVSYMPPSTTDNDPTPAIVTCDHPSGSSFPTGTTPVICTATDAAGNTSPSCTFNVTVQGNGNGCTLGCPSDITVDADAGSCGAIVHYDAATASTECGAVTYSKASDTLFPVGTTIVTATSESGQTCHFNVTVRDKTPPTISCPAPINVNAAANACQAVVNHGTATATDSCSSGVTVSGVRDDGDPLDSPYLAGTTIITWTATDAAGNTASCTQTITVKDTTPPTVNLVPTITLTAPADSCQVEVPDVLGEGGFGTASDNCAGPDRLVIRQSPAAGTLVGAGDHPITVTVYDGDPDDPDNPIPNHTTKTTNLHVIDNAPPTIALNGANPMTVECHTTFTDPGATATDACAGSFAATASGAVDVNTPGSYTITYNASDPAGNAAAPVTRTVTVVDTQAPTIALNGANPMTVECHTTFTDPGATASDACAGDLTGAIVTTGSVDPNVVGSYTLTYTVSDGASHTVTATRTVNVVDTQAPTITLNGVNPMTVECHTTFTDPGATADDACAGSRPVTASGSVNANVPGTYTITYSSTDPAGHTATATRTVNVVDTIAPTITLAGANPMTVECHTTFTDPGATATDACAGNLTSAIVRTGSVDPNVVSSYTLTYTVSDGFKTTTATRVVNVVDTTPPTITLNGQNITLWPPNHQYTTVNVTDLVASASDGCDTSITRSNVFISKVTSDEVENGNGDGNTLNDIIIASGCKSVQLRAERDGGGDGRVYTITFKVRDAAGNVTTKTAQVKVPKSQGNNGGAVDSGVHYTVTSSCP